MNIAILDYTMSRTHIRLNLAYFEQLRKIADLYIVNSNGYYDCLSKYENVNLFTTKIGDKPPAKNSLFARFSIIDNMRLNSQLFKRFQGVKFDAIIVLGFEILTFATYRMFVPKGIPVFLFQHQQIDELKNGIKRLFFNRFKNKVRHIVLEEDYLEYLVKMHGVNCAHIVHYISYLPNIASQQVCLGGTTRMIVSLSSNNDESVVWDIVRYQADSNFLKSCNSKMYIRSKKTAYKDDWLVVVNEYLTAEEYDKLFCSAIASVAAVPDHFVHRLSAPVLDAALAGKVVFCSNESVVSAYKSIASSIVRYFKDAQDLALQISTSDFSVNRFELKALRERHSPEMILKEFMAIFCPEEKCG